MSKIDEFRELAARCEPASADALIDRIRGTGWATAEERSAAQALVILLERLKSHGQGRRGWSAA